MIWLIEKSKYHSKSVQHIQVHQRKKRFLRKFITQVVILSILPGFAKKYEPSVIFNKFPQSKSVLFDAKSIYSDTKSVGKCRKVNTFTS